MELKVTMEPIGRLQTYVNNAKIHTGEQIEQIKASIREFGFNDPIGVWTNAEGKSEIVEGHGRYIAATELGMETVPVIHLDSLTDEQRRAYCHTHNQTTMNTGWDFDTLQMELDSLDFDFEELGFDNLDAPPADDDFKDTGEKEALRKKFVVPPFSVFDGRQGYWNERKRSWKNIICDTGQARSDATVYDIRGGFNTFETSVSIFDPVLAEVLIRYFCPQGDSSVFDPFSGDTVIGFVSRHLGKRFTGIELRQEQVDFNNQILADNGYDKSYICDDGRNLLNHIEAGSMDMMLTCPPYFDLEVYSDKPNDASNQETFEEFYAILDTAFRNGAKALKDNRFAVVVVGDVRNKQSGFYYDFIGNIVRTFNSVGMGLYNSAVLVTPVGTAAVRAENCMKTRKLCKVHQSVLVFYKGDTAAISREFKQVEVGGGELFDACEDE